jgi:DNA-binding LacI/PurR family transcriptional regulator
VSDLPPEISGGREGVRELARRGELPTAILCSNDWVALGAFMELQANGIKVPQDVSIVGHDDVPFCTTLEPELTSISRSEQGMVSEGIRLLLEAVGGSEVDAKDASIEGAVVWRESTGPAPERLLGS